MTKEEYEKLRYTVANNSYNGSQKEVYGWWAQQHGEEFWQLLDRCNGAKHTLEIGVNHGGTMVFWDHLVGSGGLAVGVEIDEDGTLMSMFNPVYCDYKPKSHLYCLRGDSHSKETFNRVASFSALKGGFDVLFIDGDHSYEGCKQDFEMYSLLVRPGGIIGIHDVGIEPRIQRFWNEIQYRKELIHLGGPGIGVVYV